MIITSRGDFLWVDFVDERGVGHGTTYFIEFGIFWGMGSTWVKHALVSQI